jgi:imidazolonepropionase-like amidohydrolase
MGRKNLGLIAPGYLADLIVMDGDPSQDVRILSDPDRRSLS